MDILPSGSFFKELQIIHETGYFPEHFSVEDKWEQVSVIFPSIFFTITFKQILFCVFLFLSGRRQKVVPNVGVWTRFWQAFLSLKQCLCSLISLSPCFLCPLFVPSTHRL